MVSAAELQYALVFDPAFVAGLYAFIICAVYFPDFIK